MATPLWIQKLLRASGIRFEERHHPEAFTAQTVAHEEHISGHRMAKVVVVIADGQPVELVLPASRQLDFERVATVLHAHDVRLAREEEMKTVFADCEVGATPALRHWKGVDVLMDRSLDVEGDILFQAGTHQDAIRLNFRDWFELVQPRVAVFARPL